MLGCPMVLACHMLHLRTNGAVLLDAMPCAVTHALHVVAAVDDLVDFAADAKRIESRTQQPVGAISAAAAQFVHPSCSPPAACTKLK